MTTQEREELLKLWRDVPDTQPEFLRARDGEWLWEVDLGIDKAFDGCGGRQGWEAAAIARDALGEYLLRSGYSISEQIKSDTLIQVTIAGVCGDGLHRIQAALGRNRTLALINACRILIQMRGKSA
ncbi:MAG: hypothetical protein KF805_12545 [Phycisphaeraceae bacterium]|nr:hypothetical protein [Phycisphaeraceae bacterium]